MIDAHRHGLRRLSLAVGLLAAGWACLISVTGGFLLQAGTVRISSRNPFNSLILAAIGLTAAVLLAPRGRRDETLAGDLSAMGARVPARARAWWGQAGAAGSRVVASLPGSPGTAAVAAFLLAVLVTLGGILHAPAVVGGSDAYGYVSQAHLWTDGLPRAPAPLVAELRDLVPPAALAPLAYHVSPDGTALVPTYAPGLPMLMSVFERLFGREAVFHVPALMAGLAIWATYLLGRQVHGARIGVMAAVFLATSPSFQQQLFLAPMSDIPAAACWTLALAVAGRPSRRAAAGAGLATGMGILIRPNLVPLALVPGALLLWSAVRPRPHWPGVQRVLLFAVCSGTACLVIAWYNASLYGSPLTSGYGPLANFFSWNNLPANLQRYPVWLLQTQTPLVLVAIAAPWLVPPAPSAGDRRAMVPGLCAFVLVTFACYAWYIVFDEWRTLRFLLPAFPALFVLLAAAIFGLAPRLPRDVTRLAPLVLAGTIAVYGMTYARQEGAYANDAEWRYSAAGAYVAANLPARAVVFAMQHSGSVRYYSGRPTIRYDQVPSSMLDPVIERLRALDYDVYFLLDAWEEAEFRALHAATSRLGALDWPPLATLQHDVHIYDPEAATRQDRR